MRRLLRSSLTGLLFTVAFTLVYWGLLQSHIDMSFWLYEYVLLIAVVYHVGYFSVSYLALQKNDADFQADAKRVLKSLGYSLPGLLLSYVFIAFLAIQNFNINLH